MGLTIPIHTTNTEQTALLQVQPHKFDITVELNKETYVDLLLYNNSNHYITFKVKTTNKERYMLHPTTSIILPYTSKTCKIVLCKFNSYDTFINNDRAIRDKFLIQSNIIHNIEHVKQLCSYYSNYNNNDYNIDTTLLTQYWKQIELNHKPSEQLYTLAEQIIKVRLNIPNNNNNDKQQHNNDDNRIDYSSSTSASATNNNKYNIQDSDKTKFNNNNNLLSVTDAELLQRVKSVNNSRYKYTTANTVDVSTYDKVDNQRKTNDINELMDYTVKLQSQLDNAKNQLKQLQSKYQQQNNIIQKLKDNGVIIDNIVNNDNTNHNTTETTSTSTTSSLLHTDKTNPLISIDQWSLIQMLLVAFIAYLCGRFSR